MSTQGREATREDSKSPLASALAGLGLAGAILTVVTAFEPVIRVFVITVEKASYTGYDRHSVALPLLGLFGLAMVVGSWRGARPAMVALAAAGVAVLLIAVLLDLPDLNKAGVWPQSDLFEDAAARKGPGYLTELAGGICMLLSGVSLLVLGPRRLRSATGAGSVTGPGTPPPPPAPAQIGSGTRAEQAPAASSSAAAPAPPPPTSAPSPPSPPRDRPLPEEIPSAAHPSEERDPFAPRERPAARRRSGGIVGRLRGRG